MWTPGRQVACGSRPRAADGVHDVAAVRAEQHHHDAGDRLALAVVGDRRRGGARRRRARRRRAGRAPACRPCACGARRRRSRSRRWSSPWPRTVYDSSRRARRSRRRRSCWPRAARRRRRRASSRCAWSRARSTTTWNCLSSPPMVLTSTTPGTPRSLGHDLPVEQGAELHRRVVVRCARRTGRSRRARCETGASSGVAAPRRKLLVDAAQALEHELAREPDVGAVVEARPSPPRGRARETLRMLDRARARRSARSRWAW